MPRPKTPPHLPARRRAPVASTVAALVLCLLAGTAPATSLVPPASFVAQAAGAAGVKRSFDGVVEAVRQTVVAAQVAGAVVEIAVRPGQAVRAGQLLVRLDARAAEHSASASLAQAQAADAALALARSERERQRLLRAQGFISASALDRAEAEYRAGEANHRAQMAQADAARTDAGLHVLRAPYDGVVAEVPIMPGEMALPGRALVQMFDPAQLRVSATLPQGLMVDPSRQPVTVEVPDAGGVARDIAPTAVQVLPLADATTQTAVLRAELPREATAGLMPGRFARVWLQAPSTGATAGPVQVPLKAVVRRGEVTGLYVLDGEGRPLLRQVRLAAPRGGMVDVLAGLRAGERVVSDPAQLALGEAR
ncbi:MAG: efflux RND transporter periplasmic adaptor subunit [Burkholderiales bacterium]|nr:efflux RND transporter periplasmic adaptor subunit [Burkholderiales bacterium]